MKALERLKMEAIFWLARRQPTCRELAPWMSQTLDRRLPLGQRLTLKLHFWICEGCRRYQQHLISLQQAYRRQAALTEDYDDGNAASHTPAPRRPALSDEARERMKRALSGKD
jgi:hypothetical protein